MNRIKEVLAEHRIKKTTLAQQLDKNFAMVNAYVKNHRQPSLESLYKIAHVLCVVAKEPLVLNNEIQKDEK